MAPRFPGECARAVATVFPPSGKCGAPQGYGRCLTGQIRTNCEITLTASAWCDRALKKIEVVKSNCLAQQECSRNKCSITGENRFRRVKGKDIDTCADLDNPSNRHEAILEQ